MIRIFWSLVYGTWVSISESSVCDPLPVSFLWSAKLRIPSFLIFEVDINMAFDVHMFVDLMFLCLHVSIRAPGHNFSTISLGFHLTSFTYLRWHAVMLSKLASVLQPQSAREQGLQTCATTVSLDFQSMPLPCSYLLHLSHIQTLRRQLIELLLNCTLWLLQ